MLSQQPYYYHNTIKYISIFGQVFNGIRIDRSIDGTLTEIVNIPIQYAGKDKMITRVIGDPDINRPDSIILPRMSFELKNMVYDTDRKLQSIGQVNYGLTNSTVQSNYNAVPYNFVFGLYIYIKNPQDGTKIIEQILPFFKPFYNVKAFMMPGMPSSDVPIVFDGMSFEDQNSEDFKERRVDVWNLGFTVKGNLYGPTIAAPVINVANVTYIATDVFPAANTLYQDFGLESIEAAQNNITISTNTSVIENPNDSISFITTGLFSNN